jgi:hypothetical protein
MGQRRDEGRNLKDSDKSGADQVLIPISEKGRGLIARGPSRLPAPLNVNAAMLAWSRGALNRTKA